MKYFYPEASLIGFISKFVSLFVFISLIALLGTSCFAREQKMNGFVVSNASIDKEDIMFGGPPRDGIPSIDNPDFIPISRVDYLRDKDIILSVKRGGEVRGYPTRIIVWHEIVNDVIAGDSIVVTYCPLCGTGMVFDRNVDGKVRTFGVSGLLYQSDVLMYDRETESLWSQLAMKGVSGPAVDQKLTWIPSEHLTWKAWQEKYPDGKVLSINTGYSRNYAGEAYAAYFASDAVMFPVPQTRKELPNKAKVIGVFINGKAKAYPLNDLPSGKIIKEKVGGQEIMVSYDAEKQFPQVTDANGEHITSVVVFWFAWQAFYPDTGLWRP